MKLFWSNTVLPISLLAGTIIGAGVFSLPYVFKTTGFFLTLVYALVFCGVAITIFSMYADLLGRHPGARYVGLMRSYFGKRGYYMSFVLDMFQLFLALTVYVVLSDSFFRLIAPGYDQYVYAIAFWVLGSLALFVRNKKEALEEFFAVLGILIIMLALAILGFKGFAQSGDIFHSVSLEYVFLPFGALLFSFSGRSVIPDLVSLTEGNISILRRSIHWGVLLPLSFYLLFVVGVLGLSPDVSADAVSGLVGHISPHLLIGVGVLGLLALWSSYIAIGENVRKTLMSDVGFPRIAAGLCVVAIPIILYALGLRNFLSLVVIVGGILTATEWMCVVVMWRKSFHVVPEVDPRSGEVQPQALLLRRFHAALFYGVMVVLGTAFLYTVYLIVS